MLKDIITSYRFEFKFELEQIMLRILRVDLRIFSTEEQFPEHPKLNDSQIYSNDIRRAGDQIHAYELRLLLGSVRDYLRSKCFEYGSVEHTRYIQNDQIISN